MRLLYRSEAQEVEYNVPEWFHIVEIRPSIWNGYYLQYEEKDIKKTLVRFYLQTITFGKAKLVCAVNHDGEVMHSSYVVPKCFKFPSLSKDDYEIGPCFTKPDFRGKGIYPEVLKYIRSEIGNENTVFYMCVDDKNISSIKGIEKAHFNRCGTVRKTRLLKRYYYEMDEG